MNDIVLQTYPEIHPESQKDQLIAIHEQIEIISQEIFELVTEAINATHDCTEQAFYKINVNFKLARRISNKINSFLMQGEALGETMVRQLEQIKEERNKEKHNVRAS
jgi:hypothetical protein